MCVEAFATTGQDDRQLQDKKSTEKSAAIPGKFRQTTTSRTHGEARPEAASADRVPLVLLVDDHHTKVELMCAPANP